jgi:hypothetical protein
MEAGQTVGGARPLSIGEILDAAIKLYRRNAVTLWKIVALIVVPVQVIDRVVFAATLPSDLYAHDGTLYSYTGQSSTNAIAAIVGLLLLLLAALMAVGALSKCLLDAYIGRTPDWRESLRLALSRSGSLVWLAIVESILLALGFVALVLPGIWMFVVWSVAVPALMFEGLGGLKALGRSFDLVRGRWWATFGALLVAVLLVIVVQVVLGLIIDGAIASGLSVNSVAVIVVLGGIGGAVSSLLTYPFFAAVTAVIYVDLRVRKEALDLELLADSFGTGAPASVAVAAGLSSSPSSEPSWPPAE